MPQQNLLSAVHRAPQTFDLRPSRRSDQGANQLLGYPDELMIDWGDTPRGSKVQIYWPQASASDVVRLAMMLYATEAPRAVDLETVECTVTSRVTFVPIPFATGGNFAGLFTIELPPGVVRGQEFHIVVRRISTRQLPTQPIIAARPRAAARAVAKSDVLRRVTRDWRYVVGTFQITIPVRRAEELLVPEERTLSIMKWRLLQTPPANRWYPVLKRYVSYLGFRVNGFGGDAGGILPSPTGQLPPSKSQGSDDKIEHTGKVCEVLFDCFGDFEGFVLDSCAESIPFRSRERGIAEIILRACRERLLVAVFVERKSPHKICQIVVRC
jgi:hypothetical protein